MAPGSSPLAFASVRLMSRPTRFEDFRFLGDKRTQRVYDLDAVAAPEVAAKLDELLASEQCTTFGPDTLVEARNRGYRPAASVVGATVP